MVLRRILVVNDEAIFVEFCRTALESLGLTVTCASTGEQAVKAAEESPFDIALIKSRLPDLDSVDIFSRLRRIHVDIVGLLTAEPDEVDVIIDAVNSGFSAVLAIPAEKATLIERIQGALSLNRLQEENTRLKTLMPLFQLGRKFLAATSAGQIYNELVSVVHKELAAPCVSVMMLDKNSGELKIVASIGLAEGIAEQVRLQPGQQIAGRVFANGTPVILNRSTQEFTQFAELLERKEIAASISFPLLLRGEVAGVVNISDRDTSVEYSLADLEMLSVICSQAIMALENVLAIHERERAVRLRTLFEQYVAPEVAEFLLNRQERMLDVGEVKNLTVLFADIRNFTGLVQHISPEQLRLFLNEFFELFTNIIFTARGTLDKFMGDAALVLFGAPVPIEEPSRAAVEAAVQILNGFEKLRGRWEQSTPWFGRIGIGIGISSGEVYLGNVGSEKRLDFTVIGTNVNIAQRLASETNSGQILITESVSRDVSGKFNVIKEGSRLLRGLDQDIEVYSILPVRKAVKNG